MYAPPAGPRYDNDKGFFGSLFDFSFDNFIATKLVKLLYVLSLIGATLYAIFFLIFGLTGARLAGGSGGLTPFGLLMIILAPVVWLVILVLSRVALELVIVQFKISDDVKDIRDQRTSR